MYSRSVFNASRGSPKRQLGLNLIEVLAVLLVLSFLLGVAWPSGQKMITQAELRSVTNTAYSALLFTRHEAARLREDSYLCFVTNSQATSCHSQATDYLAVFLTSQDDEEGQRPVRVFHLGDRAELVFVGIEYPDQIRFSRLGQREPLSSGHQQAYARIQVADQMRRVEVCYNGQVLIHQDEQTTGCS